MFTWYNNIKPLGGAMMTQKSYTEAELIEGFNLPCSSIFDFFDKYECKRVVIEIYTLSLHDALPIYRLSFYIARYLRIQQSRLSA